MDSNVVGSYQFLQALAYFTVSSVGMMLGNKLAIIVLPLPVVLVIMQVIGTLVLMQGFKSQLQPLSKDVALEWLPIAFLFTAMMFTSMKSFVYVNVSTILIFRNISALVTTGVEFFVRGIKMTWMIILSETIIVIGAVMYGACSSSFNWWGFFWIILNVGFQVSYGVLLKNKMDCSPNIKQMSKYMMSYYNNLLALPLLFIMLFIEPDFSFLFLIKEISFSGWLVILFTVVLGFMISTSGFGLQKLVSATVFIVINNITKFLNIALGMLLLNDTLSGMYEWGGCIIAFFGGFLFSLESARQNEEQKALLQASKETEGEERV